MNGERDACHRAQPGGRPPAPGPLAVVQAFVNTHYDLASDHGAELLHSPDALAGWLGRHGLLTEGARADGPTIDDRALRQALELRESLRDRARDGVGDPQRLDAAGRGAVVELRCGPAGQLRFAAAPGSGVPGALGVLLAITTVASADGSWSRLKICSGDHCGWAFYDASRNRSGRWCSMSVCGGRAKARTYYRRRQGGPAQA